MQSTYGLAVFYAPPSTPVSPPSPIASLTIQSHVISATSMTQVTPPPPPLPIGDPSGSTGPLAWWWIVTIALFSLSGIVLILGFIMYVRRQPEPDLQAAGIAAPVRQADGNEMAEKVCSETACHHQGMVSHAHDRSVDVLCRAV